MDLSKPHIYIPIEIFYREINSRILLALTACLKGYRVYIGTKSGIDHLLNYKLKKNLKGGIYLYKSQIISNSNYIQKIKKVCDEFVVIDEELGPGLINYEEILRARTFNEKKTSKFFVIGQKIKKELLKIKKNFSSQIIISGWPKFDLYNKRYRRIFSHDAEKIKKKYGNFLLFTSNYGAISRKGLSIHLKNLSKIKTSNFILESATMKSYYSDFKYFSKSIKKFLKKKNKIKIIIRPHPADYFHEDWKKEFKDFNNIDVIYDNDIIPWIIASKGLIHRGCSTSIDAFFLKKQNFFFLPGRKLLKKEKNLTYDLSKKITSFDELKYQTKKTNLKLNKNVIKKLNFEIFRHKSLSSSKIMIDEFLKMDITKESSYSLKMKKKITRNFKGYLGFFLKKFDLKKDLYSKISFSKYPEIMTTSYFKEKAKFLFNNKKFNINQLSHDIFEFDV